MKKQLITWSFIILFLALADRMLFILFPNFLIAKGLSGFEIGLVFSIASLALVISRIFIGRLSDIYSKKKILSLGLLGQAFAVSLFPFVSRLFEFSLFKSIKEVSETMTKTVKDAIIADTFPKKKRPRALSRLGTAYPLGRILGSVLGFLVTTYFALAYGFYTVSFLLLLSFLILLFFQKETKIKINKIKFTITQNIKLIAIIGFLISLSYTTAYFPAFFILAKNLNISTNILFLLVMVGNLISLPFTYSSSKWMDKMGRKNIGIITTIIFSFGILFYSMATNIIMFFLFLILVSSSFYVWRIAFKTIMMDHTKKQTRGGEIGLVKSAHGLGDIIGPALGGFLIDYISLQTPFVASFLVGILAAGVLLFTREKPV